MAMKGTSFSHTFEMTFTPPKMTTDTMMTMASPMPQAGTPGRFVEMTSVMARGLHGRADAEGRDGREQGEGRRRRAAPTTASCRPCR